MDTLLSTISNAAQSQTADKDSNGAMLDKLKEIAG
jgi:hypothetical protein